MTTRDPNADHAGGDAAAFGGDPAAYEFAVAQYLGAGVAACYRGSRPYSMPAEKAMLTKWIGFYKAHRGSLIQPIVHIRRADMQSWDGWLHVNPYAYGGAEEGAEEGAEVGVAMLFNPTMKAMQARVSVPLYYTGLDTTATVSQGTKGDGSKSSGSGDDGGFVTVRGRRTAVASMETEGIEMPLRRDYSVRLEVRGGPSGYAWYIIR